MKKFPILIICYQRSVELLKVIESVKALNPSKIYFHIHDSDNTEDQILVDEAKAVIESYQGAKEVLHSKELLGTYNSIVSAFKWIAKTESTFYVFEDDIVFTGNAKAVQKAIQKLDKTGNGILKFGERNKLPIFWGWACTAKSAIDFCEFDFTKLNYEDFKKNVHSEDHFKALVHMYKQDSHMAWDDEFDFVQKCTNMNVDITEQEHTQHIGEITTRKASDKFENWSVHLIDGVIQ